jgi:hypothetical protein
MRCSRVKADIVDMQSDGRKVMLTDNVGCRTLRLQI